MKVLIISSGNKKSGINPIVLSQGESLRKIGIEVDYFQIKGKGVFGYLKNILLLKKFTRNKHFDVFHTHYSLSAFVATLSGCKPLVISLMGSDVYEKKLSRTLIRMFAKLFWQATIVKSNGMAKKLGLQGLHVIPNGVDMELFKPSAKGEAMSRIGFEKVRNIIFVSDPGRPEKNFGLAEMSLEKINDPEIRLHAVYGKPNSEMAWYYNAADLLIMTSKWEGSPNVIKEAMACNLPIVATDVGDVKQVICATDGCCICTNCIDSVSECLKQVLAFGKRTKGRERIIELGLDSQSIAIKIKSIYQDIMNIA